MKPGNRAGFAAYLLNDEEKAPTTVKQYLHRAAAVERHLGMPIESVSGDDLAGLKVALRGAYSSSYIKGLIVATHRFHEWGADEDLWPLNGIMKVKPPKERNDSPRPLSPERVRLVLASARGPLEVRAVYLPSFAGTRVMESARIGDKEWDDGWFDFVGKGDKRRQVPVHPALERVRDTILEKPYPHKESLQKAKKRVQERVGFRFRLHQLRKSFATSLHNNGVTEICRRDLMGHATGLDGIYVLVSDREKTEAVGIVDYT